GLRSGRRSSRRSGPTSSHRDSYRRTDRLNVGPTTRVDPDRPAASPAPRAQGMSSRHARAPTKRRFATPPPRPAVAPRRYGLSLSPPLGERQSDARLDAAGEWTVSADAYPRPDPRGTRGEVRR